MKMPVLCEIIAQMPKLPFEEIKWEEMILHNDENKLKRIRDGKEDEVCPTVSVSEKTSILIVYSAPLLII